MSVGIEAIDSSLRFRSSLETRPKYAKSIPVFRPLPFWVAPIPMWLI